MRGSGAPAGLAGSPGGEVSSLREREIFDQRFAAIAVGGRKLIDNLDGTAHYEEPFLLGCECRGQALDLAIRRVSVAALTLSAIISLIVAVRAAPLPIAGIAAFWASASAIARIFAAKRRRQHGRFIVDFEHDLVTQESMSRDRVDYALGAGSSIRVESSIDAQAPFWLLFREKDGNNLRLARGTADELRRVLQLFRSYNIDVIQEELDRIERE